MKHLATIRPLRTAGVPDLIRRVASTDPAEKTWTCPHCGVVPPRELRRAPGYYVRQPCPCEERRRARQADSPGAAAHVTERREQRYTWVGREWADLALREKTFASFEQARQPSAYETVWQFARQPQGVLVLYGPYGVGKTHLLAAITNAFDQPGETCLYTSAVTLFEVLQERIQQKREYQDLLKQAFHARVLVIDDLDKPKPSDFRESIYYHLIDKRTLAGLPLVISANSAPAALERWIGGAAQSRLMLQICPVLMQGPDYRLQTRKGGA